MSKTINIGALAEVVNNEIHTGENFEKFLEKFTSNGKTKRFHELKTVQLVFCHNV